MFSGIAGCLTVPTIPPAVPQSASGRPEVTVKGSVAKQFLALTVNEALNHPRFREYTLRRRDEFSLLFELRRRPIADEVVFELSVNAVEVAGNTRVVAEVRGYSIDNRGQIYGRTSPADVSVTSRHAYDLLSKVKAQLEA